MIVLIKNNSPEIRHKLREAGFSVCICASFDDSIWLSYHPEEKMPYDFHGVGYCNPEEPCAKLSPLERINLWLKEDWYFSEEREFFDTVEEFLEKYKK